MENYFANLVIIGHIFFLILWFEFIFQNESTIYNNESISTGIGDKKLLNIEVQTILTGKEIIKTMNNLR